MRENQESLECPIKNDSYHVCKHTVTIKEEELPYGKFYHVSCSCGLSIYGTENLEESLDFWKRGPLTSGPLTNIEYLSKRYYWRD